MSAYICGCKCVFVCVHVLVCVHRCLCMSHMYTCMLIHICTRVPVKIRKDTSWRVLTVLHCFDSK